MFLLVSNFVFLFESYVSHLGNLGTAYLLPPFLTKNEAADDGHRNDRLIKDQRNINVTTLSSKKLIIFY